MIEEGLCDGTILSILKSGFTGIFDGEFDPQDLDETDGAWLSDSFDDDIVFISDANAVGGQACTVHESPYLGKITDDQIGYSKWADLAHIIFYLCGGRDGDPDRRLGLHGHDLELIVGRVDG